MQLTMSTDRLSQTTPFVQSVIFSGSLPELRLHPTLSIQHVKGHQDKITDPSQLYIPALLNIQADSLATALHQVSSRDHDPHHIVPGTGSQLVIENQTIPSKHRRRIRIKRGHYRLLQYIQEKTQTTDEAFSPIDWESHAQAIRTSQIKSSTFLIKFLHKWLPVGNRFVGTIQPNTQANVQLNIR
jgi:hypothetical protein